MAVGVGNTEASLADLSVTLDQPYVDESNTPNFLSRTGSTPLGALSDVLAHFGLSSDDVNIRGDCTGMLRFASFVNQAVRVRAPLAYMGRSEVGLKAISREYGGNLFACVVR